MPDTDDIPSVRAQIQDLMVGDCFSRAVRFNGANMKEDHERITNALRAIRLSLQPTVSRVARATGRTFTIENGEFLTRSRDLIVIIVVTRLADAPPRVMKAARPFAKRAA